MQDNEIVELYFSRNEAAIKETDSKYGALCYRVAYNILGIAEDSEECVNDTYLSVWEKIPPTKPDSLKAFICRITRNISISRYRSSHSKKRYSGMETMLSELRECVPSPYNVSEQADAAQLSQYISSWLDSLSAEDCALFVRRYWFGDSVKALAEKCGTAPEKMSQRMFRLRKSLRAYLEERGVSV